MNELNGDAPITVAAEIVPLDDDLLALFAEFDRRAITLNGERQGALELFLRQHKLTGNWRLAENGRELVRAE